MPNQSKGQSHNNTQYHGLAKDMICLMLFAGAKMSVNNKTGADNKRKQYSKKDHDHLNRHAVTGKCRPAQLPDENCFDCKH